MAMRVWVTDSSGIMDIELAPPGQVLSPNGKNSNAALKNCKHRSNSELQWRKRKALHLLGDT